MQRKWWAAAGLAAATYLALRSRLPARCPEVDPPIAVGTTESRLRRAVARLAQGRGGHSGVHLLSDPHGAFAARLLLVREATQTLDLQYYIWHGDRTGTLLLDAILDAADRGVRIRLLLDDNGISGLDAVLSALDGHQMISVRLFNPFALRFPKALGFLLDFSRLNRRMHNKSLTADGAATIVGGRNIGDEYFGSGEGGLFEDLDVLVVGPAVSDVTADFERYWTCGSAYPARQILPKGRTRMLSKLRRAAARVGRDKEGQRFLLDIRDVAISAKLESGTLPLDWAEIQLISDDPAKGLGRADDADFLAGQLADAVGRPQRKLGLISGYFIPGPTGTKQLAGLVRSGVEVSILTNSFRAGDVKLVHAGYAPSREALLRAGVRLFELKADGNPRAQSRAGTSLGIGNRLRGSGAGSTAALRSGASTLHGKTMTIDDERLFVGSFNLDPRSWQLNCEMGFLIDSPQLARTVADIFETYVPQVAYELRLADGLRWVEAGGVPRVHRHEPGLGLCGRMLLGVVSRLPIRWLL